MSVALEAETRIAKEAFEACCACGSRDLAPIADLPAFPHVGVYLENPSDADAYPPVDNALSACASPANSAARPARIPATAGDSMPVG